MPDDPGARERLRAFYNMLDLNFWTVLDGSLKAMMFCPGRRRFWPKRRGSTSATGFAAGTPAPTEVEGLKGLKRVHLITRAVSSSVRRAASDDVERIFRPLF